MFKDAKAFSSFSVDDLQKAKQFYGQTLGIEAKENEMGALDLHVSGSAPILVYPKPNHAPATFTVLNFMVDNVERTVDELTSKGVRFEHYDQPEMKTDEKGIYHGPPGPNIAWFTDPAGNILSVIEM
jgi:catechol 2,3-dioxygenase-like lactoylglutathione lyase family enzyme